MKLRQQLTLVGAIALGITLSTLPLHAALEQHPSSGLLEGITTPVAISWSEIWAKLQRKEVPGGSRGNRNQPTVCAVVPGMLIDRDTEEESKLQVWGLQPVFVWQDEWSRIEVFRSRDHELLLSQELAPGARHLLYSDVEDAIPLEPGGSYYWKLSRDGSDGQAPTFGETTFRTMNEADRRELEAALADNLSEVDDLESALSQRVTFFAQRELWADVFRELYTVDDLPVELETLKNEIAGHDFCDQSPTITLDYL